MNSVMDTLLNLIVLYYCGHQRQTLRRDLRNEVLNSISKKYYKLLHSQVHYFIITAGLSRCKMSVHYTDKISHLLAMDDMAGSSLLQSIRVWTNLIRQGCQDISLIWGAGNLRWQCGVLSGGFRVAGCRCVKGAHGQRVWLWLHIHEEAQRKVPCCFSANKTFAVRGVWWKPD